MSQVNSELGRSSTSAISLGEGAVRSLAGQGSGAISMSQLRGKSARSVSIQFYTSGRQNVDSVRVQDFIGFSISTSDGVAPSSYEWGDDAGYSTASTALFYGPPFNPQGFTYQSSGNASCTVVVAGTAYILSRSFTYTAGDEV